MCVRRAAVGVQRPHLRRRTELLGVPVREAVSTMCTLYGLSSFICVSLFHVGVSTRAR